MLPSDRLGRRWALCLGLLVVGLLAPQRVWGQERNGSITGTVTDAGHYVLPGARIELEPKGPTGVSDQQGRFTIQNVPAGDYSITVSYVGLLPYTGKLTVAAGQAMHVDAVLQVAGV